MCRYRTIARECNQSHVLDILEEYFYSDITRFSTNYEQLKANCSSVLEVNQRFSTQGYHTICGATCPDECVSSTFPMSINTMMKHGSDWRYFTKLNVFYKDFMYTSIEQIPKTSLVSLLSKIAGIIVLFLGASIISLIEILELVFIVIKRNIWKSTDRIKNVIICDNYF